MSTDLRYRAVPVSVTKRFSFDAAHRLDDYVGKCANLHGHTYYLEVTFKGIPDRSGIVVDFGVIKDIVQEHIVARYDHRFLNELLSFNTTAENMATYFYDVIARAITQRFDNVPPSLERVRLWETPTSYVEVTKEDMENAPE